MNGRRKNVASIGDDLHAIAVSQESAERFAGNCQGIYDMRCVAQFWLLERFNVELRSFSDRTTGLVLRSCIWRVGTRDLEVVTRSFREFINLV